MQKCRLIVAAGVSLWLAAVGQVAAQDDGLPAYGLLGEVQVFDGLGSYTRTVTTDSAEAQKYFNQGINWLYAFNHDEAALAFTKAAEIDPSCAMAWWGLSYVQGPNYNDTVMGESRCHVAWDAYQHALVALDDETPAERGLVEALGARYTAEVPDDRTPLEAAFAKVMGELHTAYPDDTDIATLYADSMMVRHPWKLFRHDGTPARPETDVIVRTLEALLEEHPNHPGANHLYIHAIEPSNDRVRGIPAADRLCELVPSSGHMRHMPSHIYVQVGMWERAIEQNERAMAADAAYREKSPEQIIQHMYMAHNAHMLAFAAMMAGREEVALAAARTMWDQLPEPVLRSGAPYIDMMMCSEYDVLKRFGRWDELIAKEAPPDYLPLTNAMWRAHRAVAFAAKKDFERARSEQTQFREVMQGIARNEHFAESTKTLLVSEYFIEAEIELQRGNLENAAALLEQAAAIEDTIGYGEPPVWLQPVRHTLGVVYMQLRDYPSAERVYREDLEMWPGNAWGLLGLSQALKARGQTDEALRMRAKFDKVWVDRETEPETSCKCVTELGA